MKKYWQTIKILWLFLSLVSTMCIAQAKSNIDPGETPGSFEVTQQGSASYVLQIKASPGTAGMEPKLSLAYNNHGGANTKDLGGLFKDYHLLPEDLKI